MKKKYVTPEMNFERIRFEDILTNIDVSTTENPEQSGNENSGDDIGG